MYNALNEDYMFQEMHDRVARIQGRRRPAGHGTETVPNRRWWRKAAAIAR